MNDRATHRWLRRRRLKLCVGGFSKAFVNTDTTMICVPESCRFITIVCKTKYKNKITHRKDYALRRWRRSRQRAGQEP
jgi:hypothetical protein